MANEKVESVTQGEPERCAVCGWRCLAIDGEPHNPQCPNANVGAAKYLGADQVTLNRRMITESDSCVCTPGSPCKFHAAQPSPAVQTPDVLRCQQSGNPCGTDTELAGTFCLCENCIAWRALALKPEIVAPVVPVEETKRSSRRFMYEYERKFRKNRKRPMQWADIAEMMEEFAALSATEKEN